MTTDQQTDHAADSCPYDWCRAHAQCTCPYSDIHPHRAEHCRYSHDQGE